MSGANFGFLSAFDHTVQSWDTYKAKDEVVRGDESVLDSALAPSDELPLTTGVLGRESMTIPELQPASLESSGSNPTAVPRKPGMTQSEDQSEDEEFQEALPGPAAALDTTSAREPAGETHSSPTSTTPRSKRNRPKTDSWEVPRSRVHLGALIGSGAFGRVHVAQLTAPGGETVTVAAKMLTENATVEETQDFLREIEMLKHVGYHKHVIRLVACCTRHTPLLALLEHAPRGDLLSLLRAARGRRRDDEPKVERQLSAGESEYTNLSDSDPPVEKASSCGELRQRHYVAEPALHLDSSIMREYALQVALGMQHLEARGITHRDLAARNILVDGAGTLKVADFGLSRSGVYVHTRARPVPLRWLAPEAILHAQYCSASDVWAFAVLLWEIATLGGFPYAELSNQQVPPFLAGGSRLPRPARASPRLYRLMVECWAELPTDRPTFAQIVEKLDEQKSLYVDLPPPSYDEALCDYNYESEVMR